jgi:formate dehydrogenase subunit delta
MSHDEDHRAGVQDKIVRMANQIATFFKSTKHAEGVAGVSEHINKFWEPRMRRHLFELIEAGDKRFEPLVLEAAATIRRPDAPVSPEQAAQANAGAPEGKGEAHGETPSRIAASQG